MLQCPSLGPYLPAGIGSARKNSPVTKPEDLNVVRTSMDTEFMVQQVLEGRAPKTVTHCCGTKAKLLASHRQCLGAAGFELLLD